jgi:hypothetical protein
LYNSELRKLGWAGHGGCKKHAYEILMGKLLTKYRISGSHSGGYEEYNLLGHNAV